MRGYNCSSHGNGMLRCCLLSWVVIICLSYLANEGGVWAFAPRSLLPPTLSQHVGCRHSLHPFATPALYQRQHNHHRHSAFASKSCLRMLGIGHIKRDVVVIGGGLAGLSTAIELARKGRSVTVLSRKIQEAASVAAGGMIAPQAERLNEGPYLDLILASREMYGNWLSDLEAIAGYGKTKATVAHSHVDDVDVGYCSRGGFLAPAFEGDQVHKWKPPASAGTFEWLEPAVVRNMEPMISDKIVGAWWYPQDMSVDARGLFSVLQKAAHAAGVEVLDGIEAEGMDMQQNGSNAMEMIVLSDGRRCHVNTVVVANGAWMRDLIPVPMEPHKGQMLSLRAPSTAYTKSQLAKSRTGIPLSRVLFGEGTYIIPKKDGRIVVGATVEPGVWDLHTTPRGQTELMEGAMRVCPALADYAIEETWAGLRPVTPDTEPVLGGTMRWNNVFVAGGYWRNGVALAPKTGQLVADAIQGTLSSADAALLKHFGVDRYMFNNGQQQPQQQKPVQQRAAAAAATLLQQLKTSSPQGSSTSTSSSTSASSASSKQMKTTKPAVTLPDVSSAAFESKLPKRHNVFSTEVTAEEAGAFEAAAQEGEAMGVYADDIAQSFDQPNTGLFLASNKRWEIKPQPTIGSGSSSSSSSAYPSSSAADDVINNNDDYSNIKATAVPAMIAANSAQQQQQQQQEQRGEHSNEYESAERFSEEELKKARMSNRNLDSLEGEFGLADECNDETDPALQGDNIAFSFDGEAGEAVARALGAQIVEIEVPDDTDLEEMKKNWMDFAKVTWLRTDGHPNFDVPRGTTIEKLASEGKIPGLPGYNGDALDNSSGDDSAQPVSFKILASDAVKGAQAAPSEAMAALYDKVKKNKEKQQPPPPPQRQQQQQQSRATALNGKRPGEGRVTASGSEHNLSASNINGQVPSDASGGWFKNIFSLKQKKESRSNSEQPPVPQQGEGEEEGEEVDPGQETQGYDFILTHRDEADGGLSVARAARQANRIDPEEELALFEAIAAEHAQ